MKKVYKDSVLSEQVVSAVLPNGLKILIAEKKDFKTNFAIFGTKYGSIDTAFSVNDGETIAVPEGIAHYLEHKLFESEDGDAFARFSETGASANAFTSASAFSKQSRESSLIEEMRVLITTSASRSSTSA